MSLGNAAWAATVLVLGSTLAATRLTDQRKAEGLARPLEQVPMEIEGWRAVGALRVPERALERLQPTEVLSRMYERNGKRVQLFAAYYAQQRAGETMHSPKQCLPGSGWEIWKSGSAEVEADGGRVRINKYGVQKTAERMLVLYWYQAGKRVIASEYMGKLMLVRDALLEGKTSGFLVRVAMADEGGAEQEGITFAEKVIPEIARCSRR